MASKNTIANIMDLLFSAPLNFKPRPLAGQTEIGVIQSTVRVFEAILIDLEDDLLMAAVIHYLSTEENFPTPAGLRKRAVDLLDRADGIPDAFTAWAEIKRTLRGGPEPSALALQAINSLGGLAEYGKSNIDDETSWRAQFIRAYGVLQQRRREDSMLLPQLASYIQGRKELGGQSIGGMIAAVAAEKKI